MSEYHDFLRQKRAVVPQSGFAVDPAAINPKLFAFQRDCVRWALLQGRAALLQECGLGKTAQQLEWARHVAAHTGERVLILAPLAVAQQTVHEGEKFGVEVRYALDERAAVSSPISITNYERAHLFDLQRYAGAVLDESSILKNLGGKTFWQLVRGFENTPFKLACTATPAPNDFVEFSNHSTWLGVMHFKEVLARWFTGDQKLARSAVLKKHAEADWWRWLTSWAVCLSRPADLGDGYALAGYDLPPLHLHEHRVRINERTITRAQESGMLFPDTNPTATGLYAVKRESLQDRVAMAVEIARSLPADEPLLLWCDTNDEADALMAAFPDAVEVRGNHSAEVKEARLLAFAEGKAARLITKTEIAGFGLNYQHCAHMIFIGVSYSFEKLYQALRRSWRFGQTRAVHAHLIYSDAEGSVLATLKEKQRAFAEMQAQMNLAMREHGLFREQDRRELTSAAGTKPIHIPSWLQPHIHQEDLAS